MDALGYLLLDHMADTDYDILTFLKQRYSPRIFKNEKVPKKKLHQLFEAARWAASSNNLQPWRFIYSINGTKAFDEMVDCLSNFNKKWVPNAPVLVLSAYKEKTKEGKNNFHALHDLGLSLGNMTIQAQYMGIALHHMAGIDWKKAQDTFGVPEGFHITTAIAIGYYGGELEDLPTDLQLLEEAKRERIPQKEFVFKDRWS